MGKRASGKWIVLDVRRGQWGESKVSEMIRATAVLDGPRVDVVEEQEPGSAGKAVIAARLRLLAGFTYKGKTATGDKVTRAKPLSAQVGGRNVQLYRDPAVAADAYWIRKWLAEFVLFPNGKWKDQVDSSTLAFEEIALGPQGFRVQKLAGH
jgi:predicted phage terminase large subunit-like protein